MKLIVALFAFTIPGCVTHSTVQAKQATIILTAETQMTVKGLPLP